MNVRGITNWRSGFLYKNEEMGETDDEWMGWMDGMGWDGKEERERENRERREREERREKTRERNKYEESTCTRTHTVRERKKKQVHKETREHWAIVQL